MGWNEMNNVLTAVNPLKNALWGNGRARYQTARRISQFSSPPITGIATLLLCATAAQSPFAWQWAAVYAILSTLLPMLFVYWLYRQGHVTDLNMNRREERFWPYVAFIMGATAGWWLLTAVAAPLLLQLLATIVVIQALLSFLITTRWKISAHSSHAATLMTLALYLYGATAVPIIIALPLIAWSRVYLNRHTPAQVIAGAWMGVLTSAAILTCGG
jgi:membrane-associated phospholipid phosphatase